MVVMHAHHCWSLPGTVPTGPEEMCISSSSLSSMSSCRIMSISPDRLWYRAMYSVVRSPLYIGGEGRGGRRRMPEGETGREEGEEREKR